MHIGYFVASKGTGLGHIHVPDNGIRFTVAAGGRPRVYVSRITSKGAPSSGVKIPIPDRIVWFMTQKIGTEYRGNDDDAPGNDWTSLCLKTDRSTRRKVRATVTAEVRTLLTEHAGGQQ